MISRTAGALLVFSGFAGYALAADAKPEFEVASIKPAAAPGAGGGMFRMGSTGGPGTRDPGRYSCEGCPLIMLVTQAYDLKRYQVGSYPSWMDTERFNVTAKVPEGATKEQFRLMQQNLLADRFGLKIHFEKKEMPTYELVLNKGGHKMKDAVEDPNAKDAPPPPLGGAPPPLPPPPGAGGPVRLTMGRDGFPEMPAGMRGRGGPMMMMMNGRAKMRATDTTMEQLVNMLSNQLAKPVTDGTGLKGKYEFELDWAPDHSVHRGGPMMGAGGGVGFAISTHSVGGGGGGGAAGGGDAPLQGVSEEPSGPTIFAALQQQLGLKLEQKKGQVDILTVDKIEKTPTEN